jgi:hypothetical protein
MKILNKFFNNSIKVQLLWIGMIALIIGTVWLLLFDNHVNFLKKIVWFCVDNRVLGITALAIVFCIIALIYNWKFAGMLPVKYRRLIAVLALLIATVLWFYRGDRNYSSTVSNIYQSKIDSLESVLENKEDGVSKKSFDSLVLVNQGLRQKNFSILGINTSLLKSKNLTDSVNTVLRKNINSFEPIVLTSPPKIKIVEKKVFIKTEPVVTKSETTTTKAKTKKKVVLRKKCTQKVRYTKYTGPKI